MEVMKGGINYHLDIIDEKWYQITELRCLSYNLVTAESLLIKVDLLFWYYENLIALLSLLCISRNEITRAIIYYSTENSFDQFPWHYWSHNCVIKISFYQQTILCFVHLSYFILMKLNEGLSLSIKTKRIPRAYRI